MNDSDMNNSDTPIKKTRKPRKATPAKKKVVGRISKYNPKIHPAKAKEYLKKGLTKEGCARSFGIAYNTLRDWELRHPEFAEATREGCDQADEIVISSLFLSASGHEGSDERYYAPNQRSIEYWLNNRRPDVWRTRKDVVADVKVTDLSEDEINKKIAALIGDDS